MRKFIAIKEKVFLYSNSDYILLQSEVSSLTSPRYLVQTVPSKKKTSGRKKEGEGKERAEEGGKKEGEGKERAEEGKRKERGGKEEKKKRDGKSLCGRKGKGRMRCEKKEERKEERMKEKKKEKKEDRERGTRSAPPSSDAFPSTKLGNNITPIKGRRLGKNTTPTSRDPIKLN